MTLVISKVFTYDDDAATYIQAVEGASGDNQALEPAVRQAINNFVVGCKQDNIWTAIKASCILAGARTLAGALMPLVGTAPTNFNFVAGDYNRKTGLVGDGSTKHLDSNRNNDADPQNSKHISVYVSLGVGGDQRGFIGAGGTGGTSFITGIGLTDTRCEVIGNGGVQLTRANDAAVIGFKGASRFSASSSQYRSDGTVTNSSQSSIPPISANIQVFRNGTNLRSMHRLAFYSIGESLDLALLDARVTTLINAFAAAIP